MASVLVVDDEEGIRAVLSEALKGARHDTAEAADAAEALRQLEDRPFDVMLSDLRMPGIDGMELVRRARARWPAMQIIVLTAHGSIGTAVEAMKLGAFHFVEKPIASPDELRALVQRALNWRSRTDGFDARDRRSVARHTASTRATGPDDAPRAGRWAEFLWQMRRRHVYTVAVAYAAATFLLLQAAELILPALPLPDWTYNLLVALALAGFPVALLLGWVFDITAKGIRRTGAKP